MLARLLETTRKGAWTPAPEVVAELTRQYVDSAKLHGFSCSAFICQNPMLAQYTLEQGRIAGLPDADLQMFQEKLEQATGKTLQQAATDMRRFINDTEQRHAERAAQVTSGVGQRLEQIKGKLMEKQSALEKAAQPFVDVARDHRDQVVASLVLMMLASLSWWWLRRRMRTS